jgi:hypothetical protein
MPSIHREVPGLGGSHFAYTGLPGKAAVAPASQSRPRLTGHSPATHKAARTLLPRPTSQRGLPAWSTPMSIARLRTVCMSRRSGALLCHVDCIVSSSVPFRAPTAHERAFSDPRGPRVQKGPLTKAGSQKASIFIEGRHDPAFDRFGGPSVSTGTRALPALRSRSELSLEAFSGGGHTTGESSGSISTRGHTDMIIHVNRAILSPFSTHRSRPPSAGSRVSYLLIDLPTLNLHQLYRRRHTMMGMSFRAILGLLLVAVHL